MCHKITGLHVSILSFFSAQCISLIFALLLPSVNVSLYFYTNGHSDGNENESVNYHVNLPHTAGSNADEKHVRNMSISDDCDLGNIENSNSKQNFSENVEIPPTFSLSHAIQRIANHIKTSYSNITVIQWSILWAMSMCGFLQVRAIKVSIFIYLSLVPFFFLSRLCQCHFYCSFTRFRIQFIP